MCDVSESLAECVSVDRVLSKYEQFKSDVREQKKNTSQFFPILVCCMFIHEILHIAHNKM